MKNIIYQTIIGLREGYVVHVNYDKRLFWDDEDNSYVIFTKGCLNIELNGPNLTITADETIYDNPTYVVETNTINLVELSKQINVYQHICFGYSYGDCIIIRLPDFMRKPISMEDGFYVNDVETAEVLLKYFCDNLETNIKIMIPTKCLSMLNEMIKCHSNMLSHVEYVSEYYLKIVTNYNPEAAVSYGLNKMYIEREKSEEEFRRFTKHCNLEKSFDVGEDLDRLMNLYSETSRNPYENVSKKDIGNDDEYYALLKDMKNRL